MRAGVKRAGGWLMQAGRVVFYLVLSTWIVLTYPMISIAFIAVWVASKCKNEYERVVVSAAVSVVAAFLILNFAELAILATVLPVHDISHAWGASVLAA